MGPYEILGVPSTSTPEELRRSYKRAALRLHPDRAHMAARSAAEDGAKRAPSTATFRELQACWALVGTSDARARYDAEEAARVEAVKRRSAYNIEIDLDEMEFVGPSAEAGGGGAGGTSGEGYFAHPCRCGSRFDVKESELEAGIELLQCDGCSQIARVLYEVGGRSEEEEDDAVAESPEEEQCSQ